AFVAKADDASAVFYNPAGLARQYGLHVYVGGMLIFGRTRTTEDPVVQGANSQPVVEGMTGEATSEANNGTAGHFKVGFIPNVYASYGLDHNVAVGVGLFTNVGLKSVWPEDWPGRLLATYSDLESMTLNPALAWSPVKWFSVGAGIDLTWARAKLRRFEDLV